MGVPTVFLTRIGGGARRWRIHNDRGEWIELTTGELAEVLADVVGFADDDEGAGARLTEVPIPGGDDPTGEPIDLP